MDPALREALLATKTVSAFLSTLHGEDTLDEVAGKIRDHGGAKTGQGVGDYSRRGSLPPHAQRAYAVAYGFTREHDIRAHLVDLVADAHLNRRTRGK